MNKFRFVGLSHVGYPDIESHNLPQNVGQPENWLWPKIVEVTNYSVIAETRGRNAQDLRIERL